MYLMLFEDGSIWTKEVITDDDKRLVDDNRMILIDLSGDNPREYFKGDWEAIPSRNISSEKSYDNT